MQTRKNAGSAILLILAIALALLLTSCRSSPEVVTVTQTVPPPAIEFPLFPDPAGFVEYSEDGLTVLVDSEFWIQIAEFAIDAESARLQYESFREVFGGDR
jgi:hypothetical protein